jgi:hypothetical protein
MFNVAIEIRKHKRRLAHFQLISLLKRLMGKKQTFSILEEYISIIFIRTEKNIES